MAVVDDSSMFPQLSVPPGAETWRQGADTCVLDMSVGCKDDSSVERAKPGYISRIVRKGSQDALIERTIKSWFPNLVTNGLLAVSEFQCTPKFQEYSNLKNATYTTGPCSIVKREYNAAASKGPFPSHSRGLVEDNYDNLVTKKYESSFYEFRQEMPSEMDDTSYFQYVFSVLRGAMNAAVATVPDPDNFPSWVIHADLHQNNILLNSSGGPDGNAYTALADWGRAILIPNINDPEALHALLAGYSRSFEHILANETATYKQYPHFVIYRIVQFIRSPSPATYNDAVDALRVWNVAAIVNSLGINPESFGGDNGLEYTYTQAALITKINKQLVEWLGPDFANYIDLPGYAFQIYTRPQPVASPVQALPPVATFNPNWGAMPTFVPQGSRAAGWNGTGMWPRYGGKGKRLRKTKKALKKKSKTKRRR